MVLQKFRGIDSIFPASAPQTGAPFLVFLVIAPGECIFIKKNLIWLLLQQDERGDQLVSQCVLVFCEMSSLHMLLSFFKHCCLSSLLVAQLLLLCTLLLFFALCHWANDSCHLSAFGPCLLCTMLFLFTLCCQPVVLCTFSLFLCTKSLAFRLYQTGDQPVDSLGFLVWILGFLGSPLACLPSILTWILGLIN